MREPWVDSAPTRTVSRELPGRVGGRQSASLGAERDASRRQDGWRWLRRLGYAAYCGVLVAVVSRYSVPTGRLSVAVIVVTGLVLSTIGRGWRQTALVARDWLPFTAVLVAYDQTRGLADALGMRLHETDVLRAERWLFGGVEPTAWLQDRFYRACQVSWYDALATVVYTSHFLVTPVLAAVLWLRNRAEWLRFITRVIVLSVASLITYGLFPEAPPWFAGRDGLSEPVARLSAGVDLVAPRQREERAGTCSVGRFQPGCGHAVTTHRVRGTGRDCARHPTALQVAIFGRSVSRCDGSHAGVHGRALRAGRDLRCRIRPCRACRCQPMGGGTDHSWFQAGEPKPHRAGALI